MTIPSHGIVAEVRPSITVYRARTWDGNTLIVGPGRPTLEEASADLDELAPAAKLRAELAALEGDWRAVAVPAALLVAAIAMIAVALAVGLG